MALVLPSIPVIPGFHPDPSLCRVGPNYYLATSSFEYSPGVPLFRSTDLRTWEQIGNVLDRPEQFDPTGERPSGGIFAPTLRFHNARFWMITTDMSSGAGQLIVTASDPAGRWSEPTRVEEAVGIDPDLAWDETGTCWLTWSGADEKGVQAILQAPLNVITGGLLAKPRTIWHGTGGQYPEGPHLYKVGALWYLLIAEGGTERGHMVTIARGPSPSGPFEAFSNNPILTARSTDQSIQNTGHADLVERADGSWALVFLAVRPQGATPSWHVLGRETFAMNVEWIDGWPVLGKPIDGIVDHAFREVVSDSSGRLPPTWVAAASVLPEVMCREARGWVVGAPGKVGTFVGRRQEHFWMEAEAVLPRQSANIGLELRMDPFHRVTVERKGSLVQAIATMGDLRIVLGRAIVESECTVEITTVPSEHTSDTTRRGPDVIIAAVREGSMRTELGRLDGRYISTEVAGGFTGRLIGIHVDHGSALLSSFVYSAKAQSDS